MKKYRVMPYDVVNDIWTVERRIFFIFWWYAGGGSYADCKKIVDDLNKKV